MFWPVMDCFGWLFISLRADLVVSHDGGPELYCKPYFWPRFGWIALPMMRVHLGPTVFIIIPLLMGDTRPVKKMG